MRLHLSVVGPSKRTLGEPCSPQSSHREMQWAGGGWVVFNTCMRMHSGYVRLELVQSKTLDGAWTPYCQAWTFQLLPLTDISVSLFELDLAPFVVVTFTAWVSLNPSATLLTFSRDVPLSWAGFFCRRSGT